jgi:hypothetical protein
MVVVASKIWVFAWCEYIFIDVMCMYVCTDCIYAHADDARAVCAAVLRWYDWWFVILLILRSSMFIVITARSATVRSSCLCHLTGYYYCHRLAEDRWFYTWRRRTIFFLLASASSSIFVRNSFSRRQNIEWNVRRYHVVSSRPCDSRRAKSIAAFFSFSPQS